MSPVPDLTDPCYGFAPTNLSGRYGVNDAPRIGITTPDSSTKSAQRYAAAVEAAGGTPAWITPDDLRAAKDPRDVLRTIDALLLSGGRDVDPQMYGETVIPGIGVDVDRRRYEVEVPLARAALETNVPVLGICGGMQALNVASDGSLYQDLSLAGVDAGSHHAKEILYHPVRTIPGSRVAQILQREEAPVNSSHHQAVKRPGKGAVVTASAPDGVIETIEFPANRFALGVQWHPERMPEDPRQRRLFESLVGAARAARSRSPV